MDRWCLRRNDTAHLPFFTTSGKCNATIRVASLCPLVNSIVYWDTRLCCFSFLVCVHTLRVVFVRAFLVRDRPLESTHSTRQTIRRHTVRFYTPSSKQLANMAQAQAPSLRDNCPETTFDDAPPRFAATESDAI